MSGAKGPSRLRLAAAIVIALGITSSVFIYIKAARQESGYSEYDALANGNFAMDPQGSKTYMHDMELYGGKANVIADDFNRWLSGLWRGKSLAYTIFIISAVISAGLSFAARPPHPAQGNQKR